MDQDAEIKQQICSSVVISDTQSFPLHWHISLVLTFIPVWEFAPCWEDLAKSLIISVPCSPLCWALLPKVVVCCVFSGVVLWGFSCSRDLHLVFPDVSCACFSQLGQSVTPRVCSAPAWWLSHVSVKWECSACQLNFNHTWIKCQSMQFVAAEWKESVVDSMAMKMWGVGFWGLFHCGLTSVRNVC